MNHITFSCGHAHTYKPNEYEGPRGPQTSPKKCPACRPKRKRRWPRNR